MRTGVRLGIDVGTVRVGVARSDPSALLATPVETVRRGKGDLARIAAIAAEYEAAEIVVGLPTSLSGQEGSWGRCRISFRKAVPASSTAEREPPEWPEPAQWRAMRM